MGEPASKREAQAAADRIHAFREQLDELTRERVLVLSGEQRARLDEHLDETLRRLSERFDVDVSESQRRFSLGMKIASALGGLALCAAVFLFFYRFWGLLTSPVQISILIATPLVGLAAMEIVSRRERTLYYTGLLGLVTFAAFVMNLAVLGSIFNIAPTPGGFLAWGLFGLALAYTWRLRLLLAAGLICLFIFVAGETAALVGYWAGLLQLPESFLLPGLIIGAFGLLWKGRAWPDSLPVYRFVGMLGLLLALLILGTSGSTSYLPFGHKVVEAIYQIVQFAVAAGIIWLGIRRRWPGTVNLGAAAFVIYLFTRLVEWWWDWMPKYLFFLSIGLIAIGLLAAFRKLRERTA